MSEPISEQQWRAREDAAVLIRAEQIKQDASRLASAKASAAEQKAALDAVVKPGDASSKGKVTMVNGLPRFE